MARAAWYEVRNGRRHVLPYDFTFTSFAKRRWLGRRVPDVMSEEFPAQCTAAYLDEAMASRRLLLNGQPVQPEDTFHNGDKLEHIVVREEPSVPAAPVRLLHCDESLLVVDKPAGIPVHHAGRFRRNSLVEILQAERPELRLDQACGAKGGIHVLHRLDRQTSGVLLLPRTAEAAAELGALMVAGRLRKQYLARVRGRLTPGVQLEVREPIRVRSAHGATSCDCHAEGKPACTRLRVLGYDPASETSLLLCEPATGRTHQIRLHTLHVGHPVANDPLYRGALHPAAPVAGPGSGEDPAPKRARGQEGAAMATAGATAALTEGAVDAKAGVEAERAEEAEEAEEAEVLWLHALRYWCDEPTGAPRFSYEAAPPEWAAPFLPLPPDSLAPMAASPPASPRPPSPARGSEGAARGAGGGGAPSSRAAPRCPAPVPLRSSRGQKMLRGCAPAERRAYDALWPHFARQQGRSLCGPASAAMLLRAMGSAAPRVEAADGGAGGAGGAGAVWDEALVLGASAAELGAKARRRGLTLGEMRELLQGLGLRCEAATLGSPTAPESATEGAQGGAQGAGGTDEACAPLLAALRGEGLVLLNYHMATAGQPPFGGHFSPLAAYHARSRRFLVLDVWPDTEPAWLDADALVAAMRAVDSESGLPRGWLHVSRGAVAVVGLDRRKEG